MSAAPFLEWRGEVPSLDLLNRMVLEPLPLGLRGGPVDRTFHRDLYFDAPDWTLRRRGVSCRFRVQLDDRRLLTVRSLGRTEDAAMVVIPQTFEAEVEALTGEQAIAGTSEPARRLRALIDPTRLLPRLEFETDRRLRRSRPGWFARAQFEFLYDLVTVRSQELSQTLQEVTLRQVRPGRPAFEAVVNALRDMYGLRPLLVGKFERAEKLRQQLEAETVARSTRGQREIVLIALEESTIALRHDRGTLSLPATRGSGEEGVRHLLRTTFGSGDGQLRFLGLAPTVGDRAPLEVWLSRRVSAHGAANGECRWLPLDEVLARVGSPALREPRTLAALAVAARADVFPDRTPVPAPAAPTPLAALVEVPEATPLASDASELAAEHLLNEDLSTLAFNARVLELAEDPQVPLLARVRFLSIFSANLDEFFMVRMGALARAAAAGSTTRSDDGLTPRGQLEAIALRLRPLIERQERCWSQSCAPALAREGIRMLRWAELNDAQRVAMRRYFTDRVFATLTPQAITRAPGHPFPVLPNARLCLAVVVRDPRSGAQHFACVKSPDGLGRFVPLEDGQFVPLEDVIRENLETLYPGRQVEAAHTFRITRNADLDLPEVGAASLLQVVDEETKRRPYGAVVRIEVEQAMPQAIRDLLLRELQFDDAGEVSTLGPGDLYEATPLVDLGALRELALLPRAELQYPPFRGQAPLPTDQSILELLQRGDVLVHHPYDSFEATVERFFAEAADDPAVLAIKLTLYRAGGRSGIVDALLRAAAAGKEVFVFVELKARFDEERNVDWARRLEEAGIHVVYGLVKLKTHCKTALVVRREGEVVRRYVHIGTGNYNAATAALYTDLGLLSADEELGADINDLFNELSGSSRAPESPYRQLLVAPTHLLPRFLAMIDREIQHVRGGRGGRIRAKINGLSDREIIVALYRAAQAGVEVALSVRGLCLLRPDVPGLSERIRVVSVLGRFLEHARIFHFANGGAAEYYLGSADWRPRNLRRRVEVVTPVRDPENRRRLDQILTADLENPTAWELRSDGTYERRRPRR
ncbi:MAG TPA: polyphosphate kinase 1 [Gemmatimonadales bacterium]|nr:polyphosphate kinase 1 [Gemmatimonadales bacterium]